MTSLNDLAREIHQLNADKGFYDTPRGFDGLLALVHSELSEALEEWRNGYGYREIYFDESKEAGNDPEVGVLYGWKPEGIPIELADAVIRLLDMCAHYGIDIDKAIRLKIDYNHTRPYRHGGKRS